MRNKKQKFSIWRVIKAVLLFLLLIVFTFLLLMGIWDKKSFPEQHEKELNRWEEAVENSCNISPDVVEKYLPRNSSLAISLKSNIEWLKMTSKHFNNEEEIKEKEEELKQALEKIKYYCQENNGCSPYYRINHSECSVNKLNLANTKNENPPSIFHYFGKIIEYVIGSVVAMFLVLLTLMLITLFEVYKIKNKNIPN